MGKSTINGHFQWLCQSLPEGIPIVYLIPIDGIKPVAIHGHRHPWPGGSRVQEPIRSRPGSLIRFVFPQFPRSRGHQLPLLVGEHVFFGLMGWYIIG